MDRSLGFRPDWARVASKCGRSPARSRAAYLDVGVSSVGYSIWDCGVQDKAPYWSISSTESNVSELIWVVTQSTRAFPVRPRLKVA